MVPTAILKLFLVSALSLILAGCPSDSSPPAEDGDDGNAGGESLGADALNAPLTGSLVYGNSVLDLDSGVASDLFQPLPAAVGDITVSSDGATSLEIVDGCVEHSLDPSRFSADCVVVRDNASGSEVARIVADGSVFETHLSPDGQTVAMDVGYSGEERFPGSSFAGFYKVLLFASASDGSLLTNERDHDALRNIEEFSWTPEGSIIYSMRSSDSPTLNNQLRIIRNPLTDPPQTDEILADLDDFGLEGGTDAPGIGFFDLSPDGSTLVFDWRAQGGVADGIYVLYSLDLVNLVATPLASSRLLSRIRYPRFSPDGEWVVAGVGLIPSTVSDVPPISSATVAMRLDSAPHSIIVDGRVEPDGVQFIRVQCELSCDDESGNFDYLRQRDVTGWFNR